MNRFVKGAAGVAVSALFVWLFLRGKDLGRIADEMARADFRWLAVYLLFCVVIHIARTWRWGMLLKPLDPDLTFKRLNGASAAGFMLLVVLPFRLGELARPALIADRKRITFSRALASIVVERVVDGLAMTMLLLCTLPFVSSDSPELPRLRLFGWGFFALFGGGGLFLIGSAWKPEIGRKLIRLFGTPISPKLVEKAMGLLDGFLEGLRALPDLASVLRFLLVTLAYWAVNGLGLGVLGWAFGLDLSVVQQFTLLAIVTVGVMIPAGPGMAGIFQFFIEVGLKLFLPLSVVDAQGAAYSNVVWAAQMGMQIATGLLFLLLGHVTVAGLSLAGGAETKPSEATP